MFSKAPQVVIHAEVFETQGLYKPRMALKELSFIVLDQVRMSWDVAITALPSVNTGC